MFCTPYALFAQQSYIDPPSVGQTEEIVITGVQLLRKKMMLAEKNAYDIFNKFNDEKRFQISCSISQPIGTHLEKQICAPEFEIQATRSHAQDYYESLRNYLNLQAGLAALPDGSVVPTKIPVEAAISLQRPAYRQKLKQIAVEHPEFLEAIKQFGQLREQYEKQNATEKK